MTSQLATRPGIELPTLIAGAGHSASLRFLDFSPSISATATRARQYGQAAGAFLRWCEGQGINALGQVQPARKTGFELTSYMYMRKTGAVDGRAEQIRHLRNMVNALLRQKSMHPVEQYDTLLRRLLLYIRLHLTRLSRYATMPLDHLALSTRTLIEVAIWADFITSSHETIDHYYDEVWVDIVEMSTVISSNKTSTVGSASTLKPGKHTTLEKRRELDKFWFKLCSKIIHPTAWSINIAMKPRSQFALTRRGDLASYGFRSAIRTMATLTNLPAPFDIKD